MEKFLVIAFLFSIGCMIGWVLELFFRRFVTNRKEKKWVNPGFLLGPYLPLYGSGLVGLYLLASINVSFIDSEWLQKLFIFFIMAVVMTLIEYITGIIFVKRMNVKLWDYSKEWGNIQGVICPRFSAAWAVLGAIYYFFIHPYVLEALEWLSKNLAFSFVIGLFYGVFIIDIFYSFKVLDRVRKFAKEYKIVVIYDELKSQIAQKQKYEKDKLMFRFMFGTVQPLMEHLRYYRDNLLKTVEKTKNIPNIIRNKTEK